MIITDTGVTAFEALMHHRHQALLELGDGTLLPMPTAPWHGGITAADASLLARCIGPTLDVGCGPGRLTAELIERGVLTLGIDSSRQAIRLTTERGGVALQRNIFDRIPGEGRWCTVLLADGNIGIGGNPQRLLHRCRALLESSPAGRILVELLPDGTGYDGPARLHHGGRRSQWFAWSRVTESRSTALAAAADLLVTERWSCDGRSFATLALSGQRS